MNNFRKFWKSQSPVTQKSNWTRLASTDEQEEAIRELEGKYKIVGGTTVGKSPQTVILDLTYQGGEIRINADGDVKIDKDTDE